MGLTKNDLDEMRKIFADFPAVQKVVLFGSRATGRYKSGSDVDLALIGNHLTDGVASAIKGILEQESSMPYFFDVVAVNLLDHEALKRHIEEHGIAVYVRGCAEG